ncbi:phosphonate C-P lyase system protein PhnH [Pseudorhodoplanes sp.]|uniref:phosphonate C-P lyase system protein PhnH n=1 Tax=Pseudorhodoplanes sp. TaxID=1934341 RepID=UPI00391AB741
MSAALSAAFADPVRDAQAVFRAAMNALARPGMVLQLDCALAPPAPLSTGAAAIALALADYETPLWLDAELAASEAVAAWLRFHTGAPVVADPARAVFALISDARALPDLALFSWGEQDYPDRSATLIVQVASLSAGTALRLSGPGIETAQMLRAGPLPADFADRAGANRALFPRGVDFLLVADKAVAALPRSTHVEREG